MKKEPALGLGACQRGSCGCLVQTPSLSSVSASLLSAFSARTPSRSAFPLFLQSPMSIPASPSQYPSSSLSPAWRRLARHAPRQPMNPPAARPDMCAAGIAASLPAPTPPLGIETSSSPLSLPPLLLTFVARLHGHGEAAGGRRPTTQRGLRARTAADSISSRPQHPRPSVRPRLPSSPLPPFFPPSFPFDDPNTSTDMNPRAGTKSPVRSRQPASCTRSPLPHSAFDHPQAAGRSIPVRGSQLLGSYRGAHHSSPSPFPHPPFHGSRARGHTHEHEHGPSRMPNAARPAAPIPSPAFYMHPVFDTPHSITVPRSVLRSVPPWRSGE
ncbi:hypothetical protein DENSPDRAFT_513263 [Dentipellis sp. KUC8613]|nr:hypothetical protein DENSPDRAFT_513263 [Dentipellis sp. KUC8613]